MLETTLPICNKTQYYDVLIIENLFPNIQQNNIMQDLRIFFSNPFLADSRFSFADKQRFSEEHVGKLTAMNSSGQYGTMLADTVSAHRDYFGDFTSVKVNEGLQQAQTQVVDELISRFKVRVSRLNKFLEANEVNKTPIYQVFFPVGVLEFSQNTIKSNAESHIDRMVSAITAHTAEAGGPSVLAEFVAFQTDYAAARGQQLLKKAVTSSNRTTRDEKGQVWAKQLFGNLLTIAQEFQGQPERLSDFFDQSILRAQSRQDHDGKGLLTGKVTDAATGAPLANATVHVIDGKISDARTSADGSYRTQQLPIGIYKVLVSRADYASIELKVEVIDAGDTALDASLKASV